MLEEGGRESERDVLIRAGIEGAIHAANTGGQTDSQYDPWICLHQSVAPSALVQSLSGDTDDTDA